MSVVARRRVPPRAVVLGVALVAVAAVGAAAVVVERRLGPADADGVRTETVLIEAPRGRILDRSGKVLVEDATVLEVRADPGEVEALDAAARDDLLRTLTALLQADEIEAGPGPAGVANGQAISISGLQAALDSPDEVVLATGVGDEVRDAIEAEPDRFAGITVTAVGRRTYHYGALAAHVLGYSGRVTEDELEERADEDLPVDAIVGKAGVEQAVDAELRGTPGQVVYEVDAGGQRVRELTDRRTEPERGRDVFLTIDINMQYLMEKGLAAEIERRRGVMDNGCFVEGGCDPLGAASVAVDPRNGQVLAMASYPTYDPHLFVGGISTADYEAISGSDRGDEHGFPLLNRAIGGQSAPGATWKPFSAHAGLATELLTPEYVYDDTGIYLYSASCVVEGENNCAATNAGGAGNGAINLSEAITRSSDTYFYKLGDDSWRGRDRLGEEALQREINGWGFGEPTGIDLLGEAPGRVPTPDWLLDFSIDLNGDTEEARVAGTWTAGVSGNTAVGQGDVLVSPIQLAQGYATLANGGTIWRPQLVLRTSPYDSESDIDAVEPESTGEVDLPPEWRDPLIAGLDGVTKASGGTATRLFAGFDQSECPVAGKTGTAQVNDKNDTSLFAAFAPTPTESRESTIAMATVFQEAGFGAAAAGPLTRRVLEPFASMGCDIDAFGAPDSPFTAPEGGWFDVEAAQAEYVPTGTDTVL